MPVAINDRVPWARKRSDGYELKWLLSLATGSHRGGAPFLIEDLTPRSERIPQDFIHPNQVTGIEKVTIAIGEFESVRRWYGALLGTSAAVISAPALSAEGIGFDVGPHAFEFLAARDPTSPLVDWLRCFGPSPYSAVFKGSSSALKPLDPRLTHGAACSSDRV